MFKIFSNKLNVQPSGSNGHESLDHSDHTFKPGWNDIFRMNQNELEAEIRKVSRDSTLDPRRKAYLIQNLMTRFLHTVFIFQFVFLSICAYRFCQTSKIYVL